MSLFEIEGLDELSGTMTMISNNYPKEVKKFMQSEGTKLKKETLKTAQSFVDEKTGNYKRSIKRGKHYKYKGNNADSIRVYSSVPHSHLIEYGHRMVSHNGTDTGKTVAGHLIFKTAADSFENTYGNDCENFADKITEPLNKE